MSFIHLLRCKAEPLPQADAFRPHGSSSKIVADSFLKRPTAKVPRGAVWHIGNTVEIDDNGIFFALGREAVVKSQQFNEGLREFEEVEQRQAPFTVGVYDKISQAAGVMIKPGVSLNPKEIANKVEHLLQTTQIAKKHNMRIVVEAIPDPHGFIDSLDSAFRITNFEFDFSLPNPPDDERFVQRPLKEFGKRIGATEGKASLKGPSLDAADLIQLARAVAAEGDQATARIQRNEGDKFEKIGLNLTPLREPIEATPHEGTASAILRAVRNAYRRVRGPHEQH